MHKHPDMACLVLMVNDMVGQPAIMQSSVLYVYVTAGVHHKLKPVCTSP